MTCQLRGLCKLSSARRLLCVFPSQILSCLYICVCIVYVLLLFLLVIPCLFSPPLNMAVGHQSERLCSNFIVLLLGGFRLAFAVYGILTGFCLSDSLLSSYHSHSCTDRKAHAIAGRNMPNTLGLFSLHRIRVLVLLLCKCFASVPRRITPFQLTV